VKRKEAPSGAPWRRSGGLVKWLRDSDKSIEKPRGISLKARGIPLPSVRASRMAGPGPGPRRGRRGPFLWHAAASMWLSRRAWFLACRERASAAFAPARCTPGPLRIPPQPPCAWAWLLRPRWDTLAPRTASALQPAHHAMPPLLPLCSLLPFRGSRSVGVCVEARAALARASLRSKRTRVRGD
jgi:hypothetical protein